MAVLFRAVTTSHWHLPLLLLVLLAVGLSLARPPAVAAATITVDTTADELNNDGDCSLREAIEAANTDAAVDACTAGSGADTIDVPAGTYTLSISGGGEDANQTGDLDITGDTTITGSVEAATIIRGDGIGGDRVLHIASPTAVVEITGVTIEDGFQSISGNGAGILNAGALTLTDSTVQFNFGGQLGGGLHNLASGSAEITNSTFSGNTAVFGGGIANEGFLEVRSSTIASNTAFIGPTARGGGLFNDGKTPSLKNTILADNVTEGGHPDCSGTLLSAGYNLIEDTTGCVIAGDTASNITGVDPSLGALQNNGGTTETHALLEGSAAIDAGSPDCPPPSTDQRGFPRPRFAGCDIGAVELESVGGVAELPDAAVRAAAVSRSTGLNLWAAASIAAAGIAAVVLGVATWRARRHLGA